MVQGSYSGLSNYRLLLGESHDPPGIYFRMAFSPLEFMGPVLALSRGHKPKASHTVRA